jgi:O-6-methylguanine DNA methyltransferase
LGFYEDEMVSGWDAFTKQLVHAKWSNIDHRATELYKELDQQSHRSVWICGTAFQRSVWQAVSDVPKGKTVSYSELAAAINKPMAVRAVGSALGANNIAYWIPCHRAIRGDGSLGGYRWGLSLKTRILSQEATDL